MGGGWVFFLHLAILGMIHSVDAGLGRSCVAGGREDCWVCERCWVFRCCVFGFFFGVGVGGERREEEDGDEGGEWHDGVTGICSLGVTGE